MVIIFVALFCARAFSAMDLGTLSNEELVPLLAHKNSWQRRQAQRLLSERLTATDKKVIEELVSLAGSKTGKTIPSSETRLAAVQILHASQTLPENLLDDCAEDSLPEIRSWAARVTGERHDVSEKDLFRLEKLAADTHAAVRLAVATAVRQLVSSSLIVDTDINSEVPVGKILIALIKSSADAKDPLIPFMIWMASEPLVAKNPAPGLQWLAENGADTMPLSGILTRKAMRRICDIGDTAKMDVALKFLSAVSEKNDALTIAALDGLLEGQRAKSLRPTSDTKSLLEKLFASSDAQIKERAQQLGTLWGNASATERTLALLNNPQASLDERIKAIQSAQQLKNAAARAALLKLILSDNPEPLVIEGLHALSVFGDDEIAGEIVQHWKKFTPTERRAAVDTLASRGNWIRRLLYSLEDKIISPEEIPANIARTLTASKNPNFSERAIRLLGRYRDADADKLKIIAEKKKAVLTGEPNWKHGHEIAQKTCFVCHKFYGEGEEVGPDLTGVGRSTLDALLANVIDPNQIIGKGYENVLIETKDGRAVSGRMVENSDTQIKLLAAGPVENLVAKSDIATMRVSELSVMPEGLEQMPDEDFRDLIWFILNPPQDGKLTSEKRKALIGK